MNRSRRRAIALVTGVALTSGCFTYVPTQLSTVPEGAKVRVHLTPAAQVTVTQRVGRRIEDTVDGTLDSRRQNQLFLKVPVGSQQEGFFRADIAQDLQLAEPDVLGIDLRQFSGSKTALLVGGTAAGVAAIVLTIISNSRNGTQGPSGGTEEIRIPLASFGVR